MCVENKLTNNGPMWAPHGLKFQCRAHIVLFEHYAQILPIWDPFYHARWDSQYHSPVGIWCQNDVVSTSMRRHFYTKCPLGDICNSR